MNKLNFLLISLLFPRSSNCQDDRLKAEGSSIDDPRTPEAEAPEEDVQNDLEFEEADGMNEGDANRTPQRSCSTSTLPHEGESDPEVEFLEEKRMDAETGPVPVREKRKKQKHPQEDQDRMEAEEPNDAETGPVPEAEKKHPKHPQEWIDRLLIKYKKSLQMFVVDGVIHLWCGIC